MKVLEDILSIHKLFTQLVKKLLLFKVIKNCSNRTYTLHIKVHNQIKTIWFRNPNTQFYYAWKFALFRRSSPTNYAQTFKKGINDLK